MNDSKYIGLDVHQATISAVVLDSSGKLMMESILETKAATILQFIHGLRGSLHVTLEEGTCAAWLHDLVKPHVTEVLVCDPRKNALLKSGNKNDRIDARKLADLFRSGLLSAVYHGETGVRALKELARSYLAITQDLTRVMNRLKALYRSWGIPCAGERVYAPRHRSEWLAKISEAGVRRRAPPRGVLLSAAGRLTGSAPAGAPRPVSREQKTQRHAMAAPDSFDRTHSRGSAHRSDSDPAPLSHQAATVGLLRIGVEDLQQRGIPFRQRPTPPREETPGHPRAQRQP
jgi:Transposase